MAANIPRLELRPGVERRARLEYLRKKLSARAGRYVSMSELLNTIIDHFFDTTERVEE